MRENMRAAREQMNADIEASREFCPHKQGSNPLSEFQGPLGSFITHRLDTGEIVGICTNCTKVIRSTNPEHLKFFREKSANRRSSSGDRQFLDPGRAQRVGAGLEPAKFKVVKQAPVAPVEEQDTVVTEG